MTKINEKLLESYCNMIINSAKPMKKLVIRRKLNIEDVGIRTQFSGQPYWPASKKEFWNELVKKYGNSALLVQLNLSEIKDPRLPQSGLLQVFVVEGDYGLLEDESRENEEVIGFNKFHFVVYHEEDSLIEEGLLIKTLSLEGFNNNSLEYKIVDGVSVINITNTHEFDKLLKEYNISEDKMDDIYDYEDLFNLRGMLKNIESEKLKMLLTKVITLKEGDVPSSRVDGYPHFSQEDERSENTKMKELLIQLSSDENLMFGDVGDIQIFSTKEALSNIKENEVIDSYYIFQCH